MPNMYEVWTPNREPVRFPYETGEEMMIAGEHARECAADIAEELNQDARVVLRHDRTLARVDGRLAGNRPREYVTW